METKSLASRMAKLKFKLGFDGFLVVDCVGRSGGVGLFWRGLLISNFFHIPNITLMLELWMLIEVFSGGLRLCTNIQMLIGGGIFGLY